MRDRWSRRLTPQDRARSFRGFLDEVSHLGMGWLDVGLDHAGEICEVEIEGNQATRFGLHGPPHVPIGVATKAFLPGGANIMTPGRERAHDVTVDVLVELDLHEVRASGRILSRARRAA